VTRPKKYPTHNIETNAPGIPVGKGFIRRYVDPENRIVYVTNGNPPLGSIFHAIEWAIKFLKDAGRPEYKKSPFRQAYYTGTGESVQARQFQEREDPEWYAYEILEACSSIEKNDWCSALITGCKIGNLITEAMGLNYFKDTGKAGGPKERRNLSYATLTRYLVRKYRGATATELWNKIPDDTEDELPVGSNKYYRRSGRVHALRKMSGGKWQSVGKPLQYDAFRKRVMQTRKLSAR